MITTEQARVLGEQVGVNFSEVDLDEFRRGIEVEFEQTRNALQAAEIAKRNLDRQSDYYAQLFIADSAAWVPSQSVAHHLNFSLKAQWIRLADVLIIGPLMIWGGVALTKRSPVWGVILGAMGFGTIWFNGRNWWLIRQAEQAAKQRAQLPAPAAAEVPQ